MGLRFDASIEFFCSGCEDYVDSEEVCNVEATGSRGHTSSRHNSDSPCMWHVGIKQSYYLFTISEMKYIIVNRFERMKSKL